MNANAPHDSLDHESSNETAWAFSEFKKHGQFDEADLRLLCACVELDLPEIHQQLAHGAKPQALGGVALGLLARRLAEAQQTLSFDEVTREASYSPDMATPWLVPSRFEFANKAASQPPAAFASAILALISSGARIDEPRDSDMSKPAWWGLLGAGSLLPARFLVKMDDHLADEHALQQFDLLRELTSRHAGAVAADMRSHPVRRWLVGTPDDDRQKLTPKEHRLIQDLEGSGGSTEPDFITDSKDNKKREERDQVFRRLDLNNVDAVWKAYFPSKFLHQYFDGGEAANSALRIALIFPAFAQSMQQQYFKFVNTQKEMRINAPSWLSQASIFTPVNSAALSDFISEQNTVGWRTRDALLAHHGVLNMEDCAPVLLHEHQLPEGRKAIWCSTKSGLRFAPEAAASPFSPRQTHTEVANFEPVWSAGEVILDATGSKVLGINAGSGHYQPSADSVILALKQFKAEGFDVSRARLFDYSWKTEISIPEWTKDDGMGGGAPTRSQRADSSSSSVSLSTNPRLSDKILSRRAFASSMDAGAAPQRKQK